MSPKVILGCIILGCFVNFLDDLYEIQIAIVVHDTVNAIYAIKLIIFSLPILLTSVPLTGLPIKNPKYIT